MRASVSSIAARRALPDAIVTPLVSSSVEIGPSRRIVLAPSDMSVRMSWYLRDLFIGSKLLPIHLVLLLTKSTFIKEIHCSNFGAGSTIKSKAFYLINTKINNTDLYNLLEKHLNDSYYSPLAQYILLLHKRKYWILNTDNEFLLTRFVEESEKPDDLSFSPTASICHGVEEHAG